MYPVIRSDPAAVEDEFHMGSGASPEWMRLPVLSRPRRRVLASRRAGARARVDPCGAGGWSEAQRTVPRARARADATAATAAAAASDAQHTCRREFSSCCPSASWASFPRGTPSVSQRPSSTAFPSLASSTGRMEFFTWARRNTPSSFGCRVRKTCRIFLSFAVPRSRWVPFSCLASYGIFLVSSLSL